MSGQSTIDARRPGRPRRDYAGLLVRHGLSPDRPAPFPPPGRPSAMRRAVDLLWGALGSSGVSWIGFYERGPGPGEMTLVCREPKPACSPIGLHGMCGKGMQERRPFIVPDVRTLGANYVACDPRDQSEVVVPLLAADGSCDAVLDADSYDLGAFDDHDARGLARVLVALGLSDRRLLDVPAVSL